MVKIEKRDKFWNKVESEVKEQNLDSLFKLSKYKGVNGIIMSAIRAL